MLFLSILSLSLFISVNTLDAYNSCCVNHPNKPISPLEQSNYDCTELTDFGQNRCNLVYGGNICKWITGKKCKRDNCRRIPKFVLHYGKYLDVGKCIGICKDNRQCSPNNYTIINHNNDNKLEVIKNCICDTCVAVPETSNIQISVDTCKGNCNTQRDRVCMGGIDDNFITSNGVEPANPSSALISGMLSGCSAGIQPTFDFFADNKCFGHTFINCLHQGDCPLKIAYLKICMRAANVFLTHTDSLVLGINGIGLWGRGLPVLNGGTWNRGETMCLDLNLANLPGNNANILLDIQMAGHLDVMVQDDTAVDYVRLSIQYEKCNRCIPKKSSISHLYYGGGIKDFLKNDKCDCVELKECKKLDHFITYYKGTMFEIIINVGQCLGKCNHYLRCNSIYGRQVIKAPEGIRYINVIKKCICGKLQWNPYGLYIKPA